METRDHKPMTADTSKNILPCPFCGENGQLWVRTWDGDNGNGSDGYDVRCRTENCYLEDGTDSYYDDKNDVIDKWNVRSYENHRA